MAPKKKKKSKGGKLAGMSVEQRQQYLDRKAAQEADHFKRREELIGGFLKLKLTDEEKRGQMNQSKLTVKWRDIIRGVKSESLEKQLKDIWSWIQETTEKQKRLIQMLNSQVAQGEHQRTRAAQHHLTVVKKLTGLYEDHVGLLTRHLRTRQGAIVSATIVDSETQTTCQLRRLRQLDLIQKASERDHTISERDELSGFHTSVMYVTTQLEEDLATAKAEQEAALEETWMKLNTASVAHEEKTNLPRSECLILQQKVTANRKQLDTISRDIAAMQREIVELNEQISKEKTFPHLESEVKSLKLNLQGLRSSLQGQRSQVRDVFKLVNNRVEKAKERLQDSLKMGRSVLELASICKKLELPRDQNIPFLPPPPPAILLAQPLEEHPSYGEHLLTHEQIAIQSETDEGIDFVVEREASVTDQLVSKSVTKDEGIGSSISGSRGASVSLANTGRRDATKISPSLKRIGEMIPVDVAQDNSNRDRSKPIPDHVLQETDTVLETHENLRNFWLKCHQVQLERLALRRDIHYLEKENGMLRERLRQRVLSLGVSDAALSHSPSAPVAYKSMSLLTVERVIISRPSSRTVPPMEKKVPDSSVSKPTASVPKGVR